MDWFVDNWPAVLIILAVLMVVLGLVQRLVKLAFVGAAVGVIGVVAWPFIVGSTG